MQVPAAQIVRHLNESGSSCFLVHGVEVLLVEETRDALRRHFAAAGFSDVSRLTVETGFDWMGFSQNTRSLSLFAERRYIELRMPGGKPGETGSRILAEFVAQSPPDIVLVVVCGKLDKKQLGSAWCKAFSRHGTVVEGGAVHASKLPQWIRQRFSVLGVNCDLEVAARLAYFVEGNLLAADQEIRKLSLTLPAGAKLDATELDRVMADQSRYSVFSFADACVAGDGRRGLRVLRSLRQEGVEPVLLIWVLTREVRSLCLIGAEIAAGVSRGEAMRNNRVWSSRIPLVSAALNRVDVVQLQRVMRCLARLDRLIKGQGEAGEHPSSFWVELEKTALAICGISLRKI